MKVIKYKLTGIVSCFLLLTGCNSFQILSDELSASTNYADKLPGTSNLNSVQSFNSDSITGAQIDESQIKQTIHVNINHSSASDSNSGLEKNPLKSLTAALEKAKEYLRQGEGTKIIIHPGIYREGEIVFDGNNLGAEAKNAVLVIEGTKKGKVILSGSEEWQSNTWQQVGNYYQHDWSYDFGNNGGPWGKHGPKEVIAHRSEMVFINRQPLKQVLLEKYNYTWPNSFLGKGNHQYISFDAPQNVLEPGTFGVAERDENGNKIYIQPPDDIDFTNAQIEVATKRFILEFLNMENLVLRNLNFQHTASDIGVGAVKFGPWWGENEFRNSNILIEHCDFRWNNGLGLTLWDTKNVTLRHNTFNYNGFAGTTAHILMNTVWEDNETSFNNWRGYMGNWTGWAIGGAKLHWVRDGVFKRHQSIGNMTQGLWFDIGNRNILIEDLTAIHNNSTGLFLEISPGPFLVRNTLIADNADNHNPNLKISNSKNTLLENSIVYGANDVDTIMLIYDDRTTSDRVGQILGENNGEKFPINLGKTQFRNNVIMADGSRARVILMGGRSLEYFRDYFLKQDYAGSNNVYWTSSEKTPFITVWKDPRDPNREAWKTFETDMKGWFDFTKEVNSQWIDPQFVDPDNYDFRLKKSSPLKSRESSLPARKLDSSKIQELKDYQAWIDTLVDK